MTACACGLAAAIAALGSGDEARFESEAFTLRMPIAGLATLDRDGDGRLELLVARESGLEVVAIGAARAGAGATGATTGEAAGGEAEALARFELGEARTLAWCVARAPGDGPRRDAVFLVRDDGAILRWEPGREAVEIGRASSLLLPSGVLSLPFARDLDGDGRTDVALPLPAGLQLWFAGPDGALATGPRVRHRVEAAIEVPGPEEMRPEVAASLSIPSFKVEDENGDGFNDLAFESADRLQFFWSGEGGALPESPTFEIDLEELQQKLGPVSLGLIDPSNLFKAVTNLVSASVRDLDGDGLADLLLRQGPKVSVFPGRRGGVERAKAAQVLKTSGNLISAFAADDNGDRRLDLCMLQAADVSIGEVLLWVVVGGELKLDLFTYFQEAPLKFARHPSRRRRVVIEVPAILGLASDLREDDTFKRVGEELSRVPVALDLDGDGRRSDVALLRRDGTVEVHRDAAPPGADQEEDVWRAVTERFDREARGKDEVTIELLEIVDWLPLVGGRLRAAIAGRTPAAVVGAPDPSLAVRAARPDRSSSTPPATRRLLVVVDLDGDRRDDLLVVDSPRDTGTSPLRLERLLTR